jgi:type I restriction enzyme, S subunit
MEKLKNTPTLRFPEFNGEWELKKLGEITEKVNSGKTPLGGESVYVKKGILFIRSQNVLDSKLSFENSTFITEKINNTMKNSVVKANDILLNITGASLGRSCVVPNNFTVGNVNQHVCIIRLNKENEPYFIQPIFSSEKGQNIFTSLQTGSGREGLNFQSIRSMTLAFPALPEQQKIATFLTAVDEKLQALKQKKSLLDQYKKGVMQKIFSQELRFKDDNGNAFADWEEKKLGDVCEMKNGYAFKSNSYSVNGKYNIVTISNVQNGYLDIKKINKIEDVPNECLKHQILEIGDLLISLTGNVGRVCFVSELNCLLNQRVGKLIPKNISKLFLFQLLRLEVFITQMIADSQGGAQLNLSKPDIERYEIYLPSMSEQIKIATFLSAIDDKINQCQAQITNTEVWKRGLLQGMFV